MSQFKIYSSSAGSGKTFTLTKTYLGLLLKSDSPFYFKQILAITFTNDAAAEMKSRILNTLKELGEEEDTHTDRTKALYEILKSELQGLESIEIQKRAKAAFQQILEDYADFNIKTIDSFFNQLTTAFSRDLNLPYSYEIVLDKNAILLQATERVLDKIGTEGNEHISDLVQKFAEEQADNNKSWQNILPNLAQFAENIFNDQYYHLIKKNERLDYTDYLHYKKQISIYLKKTQADFLEFGKRANGLLNYHELNLDDFAYGKSGPAAFYYQIQDPDCDQLNKEWAPGKRLIDALENGNWYSKKTPEGVQIKIDEAQETLASIYHDVMNFLSAEKPKYLLLKEIRKSLDHLALLDEVKKEFDKILFDNNQAYITDFNRRIQQVIAAEPVPYIFERLGEKYNHVLIDEFQDTSDLQYYNLLPLIENGLAKSQFNMLVGDPKQSIYRWRGGKVELMLHLINQDSSALMANPLLNNHQKDAILYTNTFIEKKTLNHNYRSKKEIIDFNTAFFGFLTENLDEKMIRQAFNDSAQLSHSGTKEGGHIEFILNENKEIEETAWINEQLKLKIETVLSEGYTVSDIAILCRKKNHAAGIAEFLISSGYSVISTDSLLIKNNLAVIFIISMLKAFQDENHDNEAFMLYHRYKNLEFPITHNYKKTNFWQFLLTEGIDLDRQTLFAFGLTQLTETLANKLGIFEDKAALPYLFALLDLVQEYVKKSGNDLAEFLNYWEQSGANVSVNINDLNAITVTTIHKAKGLEYPVVFVPFANWSLIPRNNSLGWFDLENLNFKELKTDDKELKAAPLTLKKLLTLTGVKPEYETELEFTKLEALNILYVAFTRPIDRLYILAQKPYAGSENSIYRYLTQFIAPFELNENAELTKVISKGKPNQKKLLEELESNTYALTTIKSYENLGKLRIKSRAKLLFNEQNKRDKGTLIHALLSEIKKLDDLENALRKLQFDGTIKETDKNGLRIDVQKMLNHPQLKPLFSGEILVENERDILQKNEEISRPDRVVFRENKVTILDYKTGQKLKSHERQIKHYGNLYQKMGYSEIEMLLVYLNPTEVIPIRL